MHTAITLLALLACADGAPDSTDGFARDTSVRVLSPANGELVESPFVLQFEAGSGVSGVALTANGQEVAGTTLRTAMDTSDEPGIQGELTVTLEGGRWTLDLIGSDSTGAVVSNYDLMVRVEDPEETAWVSITSPSDGAEVTNPVTFSVDASDGVDRIEIYADDWLLGETAPGGTVTYEFSGTGFARGIDARAYDGDELVATDAITVTVDPGTEPPATNWNDVVNALRATYPTDGTNGYYWPDDGDWYGTTRDIWYRDTLVAEGDPYGRCYCVGLTWEVFMRAFDEIDRSTGGDGTLNGVTVDELTEFRIDWFVRELRGAGPSDALENYGLGGRVTDRDDVRPGDFIQFWRHSGSGHNAVFVEWITDSGGNIDGFRYWSTQSSTDGIGENEEYFGASGSSVDATYFFAARPAPPEDWTPYR